MGAYTSLNDCIVDLEKIGELIRIKSQVDPDLELAEIQRRAYASQSPALLFENVKGTPFSVLANLYGTQKRSDYIFKRTLDSVRQAIQLKTDPGNFFANVLGGEGRGLQLSKLTQAMSAAVGSMPKKIPCHASPVLKNETTIQSLPMIRCWPKDGGAFVTLPQVLTCDPEKHDIRHSNCGMYRIQLSGNEYESGKEIGLHYQIHRGIGDHHKKALKLNQPLKVSIFVGGPPAHTFSAVMPLPEGLPEVYFAGMLAGRRWRYSIKDDYIISSDADFCITGTILDNVTKPEGPFGDHLGYYSLTHDFPVMKVEHVYHRDGAIWPFTVVGRPPQEDTQFGRLVHEIAGPALPSQIPGVKAVNAVDASGVHPLLLAIGQERYIPYEDIKPREILTQANAILGFGQCSLAKYLWIIDGSKVDESPDVEDIEGFFQYALKRLNFERDLHFQTSTTMDTLDYSGTKINEGSKLVLAAAGPEIRKLSNQLPEVKWPKGFVEASLVMPGVLAITGPKVESSEACEKTIENFCKLMQPLEGVALIVVVDDASFTSNNLNNFLWVTFTRSNPSHDCYGPGATMTHKHWACEAPLVIDARLKPHHAPVLEEDHEISKRIDSMCLQDKQLDKINK